jgi:phosphate transport system permease protein
VNRAANLGAALLLLFCLTLAGDLLFHGVPGLFDAVENTTAGDGGLFAALISTIVIAGLGLCLSLPLALGCAYLVSEVLTQRPRTATLVRRSLDVASAAPSIAVGLVGWTLFSTMMGLGFSLVSGALTLTLMLAPLMAAAFLAGLDALPAQLRSQSLALGVDRWQTFWQLLLPSCRPALLAGVVLALGRATAETAVLILTAGISTRWPDDLFDPGASLAVHVYHLARNVPGGESQAYAAALLLVLFSAAVQLSLLRLRRPVLR